MNDETPAVCKSLRQRRNRSPWRHGCFRPERLESRQMLAGDLVTSAFQNPANRYDVTNDGYVTAVDALAVIRELSMHGSRALEMAQGEPSEVRVASLASSMYVDVNGDEIISATDATMVVRALNAEGEPGDVVTFRLETTDLAGNPISAIEAGSEFLLRVFTQDTQDTADLFGVFAAFLDVEFDSTKATITGNLDFSTDFSTGTTGSTSTPGLIDEAGGISNSLTPTGTSERRVFSVRLRADTAGSLTFSSNAADVHPANDVAVFGSDNAVDIGDILYGSTTIQINSSQTAEPDLVAFAKALADAGVELWSTRLLAQGNAAAQLDLFEEGQHFLPFNEVLDENLAINTDATAAGVDRANVWIFPDTSRTNGEQLTLEQISQRSGVSIPTGTNPVIVPIPDVTVRRGSPLNIPLDGYDPNGDPITYSVSVADTTLLSTSIPQGNRSLRITTSDPNGAFGDMVFQLFEDRASRATEQIISLANDNFYDGVSFHRIVDGFMIQGGDPTGTGAGGSPLANFDDQFSLDLQHNRSGVLSMAKGGDDTNDSQFFITEVPTRFLDFNHTIFGQLVEGERVRESISNVAVTASPSGEVSSPVQRVTMQQVDVFTDQQNGVLLLTPSQSSGSTNVTVTATDSAGNVTTDTFTVTLAADDSNEQPFLLDIPDQQFIQGETVQFQVTAVDNEGDSITYAAQIDNAAASIQISNQGLVTVTPPDGFSGTLEAFITVSPTNGIPNGASDSQLLEIQITAVEPPPAPTGVDLLAASDTGASATDNVTRLTELQFQVQGVQSGATVEVLADATVVGEGVATGTSIVITTANPSALGDGLRTITARQRVAGVTSAASTGFTILLDQTAPAAISNTPPAVATVGSPFVFDAAHIDEGTSGFVYSLVAAPAGMTVSAQTGELGWTPIESQRGNVSFQLVTTDLAGNTTANDISVTVGGGLASIRLLATDANGDPIGGVATGESFQIQVLLQDLRASGNGFSAAFVDIAFNSSLASVSGTIDISNSFPNNNSGVTQAGLIQSVGGSTTIFTGSSELVLATIPMTATTAGTLTLSPSLNVIDESTLTGSDLRLVANDVNFVNAELSILSVGTALAANDDSVAVNEDTVGFVIDVLANDTLGPNSKIVSVSSTTNPNQNGAVTISSTGRTIVYTPAANFFGSESFTYTIEDGTGATDTAIVSVTVNPVNDPPTLADDSYPADFESGDPRILQLVEDSGVQVSLPVISNDSNTPDANNDAGEIFFITSVGTVGTSGTVTNQSIGISYTAAANFFGTDTFTYTVTDSHSPALTATATVTVVVAEVNDAPVAVNDTVDVSQTAPTTLLATDLTGNDNAGPNEQSQLLTIVSVTGATKGTVELNGNGSVTYTPNTGATGSDTFTYTIRDNGTTQGQADPLEATGTVTVTLAPVVSPPTSSSFSGLVFLDSNNDGIQDTAEEGIPGVTIRLEGTDLAGAIVSRSVVTDSAGSYLFGSLAQGNYTITQVQPDFLLDGIDTAAASAAVEGNDAFRLVVGETLVTSANNTFGEQGLSPQFAMLRALASQRGANGILVATANGGSQFMERAAGWDDFSSVDVALNDAQTQLTISAIATNGDEVNATLSARNKNLVQLLGHQGGTTFLRLLGAATDYDLQPVAVDAAFAS